MKKISYLFFLLLFAFSAYSQSPPTIFSFSYINSTGFNTFQVGTGIGLFANVSDSDGTVSQVEFFVDGNSLGFGTTLSHQYFFKDYTIISGTHTLTAIATDDQGMSTVSDFLIITGVVNQTPQVNITLPSNITVILGDTVDISVIATDELSIKRVMLVVDGMIISNDTIVYSNVTTYTKNFSYVATALGSFEILAYVSDNFSEGVASVVTVNVVSGNTLPYKVKTITNDCVPTTFCIPVTAVTPVIDVNGYDLVLHYDKTKVHPTGIITKGTSLVDSAFVETFNVIDDINGLINIFVFFNTSAPLNAAFTGTGDVFCVEFEKTVGFASVDSANFYVTDLIESYNSGGTAAAAVEDGKYITTCSNVVYDYEIDSVAQICNLSTFCIPVVAVVPAVNVNGYDVELLYDKNKVTPTGNITVYSDLGVIPAHVDNFNNASTANGTLELHLFFNSLAGATELFNGTGNVFCVEFVRTSNFGSVDTTTFSIQSLQESYDFGGTAFKTAKSGIFRTYKDSTYTSGSLNFWLDNAPLGYTAGTNLITKIYGNNAANNNQTLVFVTPNSIGTFTYNVSNGLYINVERDIANSTALIQNVVNSGDAQLARRILIRDISFTPSVFQIIASDVSLDGKISAGDISQINKRSVNTQGEYGQEWNKVGSPFAGQPSKDWLFVNNALLALPAYTISATYPNNDGSGYSLNFVPQVPFNLAIAVSNYTVCPEYSADSFRGILLGDVNGNFSPVNSGTQFLKKEASSNKMVFDFEKVEIKDSILELPILFEANEVVNALDFAFQFDENKLKLASVYSNLSDTSIQVTYNYSAEHKMLLAGTNSLKTFDSKNPVLKVRFVILKDTVSQSDFTSFAGYVNGYDAGVSFSKVLDVENGLIVSVYPNPASSMLNIVSSENSTIQLFDITCRQVTALINLIANQKQELNTANLSKGVYTLKVTGIDGVRTIKVVINNNM